MKPPSYGSHWSRIQCQLIDNFKMHAKIYISKPRIGCRHVCAPEKVAKHFCEYYITSLILFPIEEDKQKQVWSNLAQSAIKVLQKELKTWLQEFLVNSLNSQLDDLINRQDSLKNHVVMNEKKKKDVMKKCHVVVEVS